MGNLLTQFGELVFNINFLWIVIAVTLTMEVMKWTFLPKDMNSKWYPIIALFVSVFWVLLKTAFTGDWREVASNIFFTVLLVDFIYTYAGQYLVMGIIALFKGRSGNVTPPTP